MVDAGRLSHQHPRFASTQERRCTSTFLASLARTTGRYARSPLKFVRARACEQTDRGRWGGCYRYAGSGSGGQDAREQPVELVLFRVGEAQGCLDPSNGGRALVEASSAGVSESDRDPVPTPGRGSAFDVVE